MSIGKRVTPQQPAAGQPVEFEIAVSNSGDDEAIGVEVTERLPDGLEIPVGLAVFVSQGSYDLASGQWSVGDLATSAVAVMTVPAQLDGTQSSPCLVNTATVAPVPGDTNPEDDRASAGVRQPGVERCVDLYLENLLFSVPQPICTDQSSATLTMWVRNRGPDEARQVSVSFSATPPRLPNLRFSDSDCAGLQPARCDLGTLEAGGLRVLEVVSDDFSNGSDYEVMLRLTLESGDPDYVVADNETAVLCIPRHPGHPFHGIAVTDSTRSRSVIPRHPGHRFHAIPVTL